MNRENFVDADAAAQYLAVTRRRLLDMTRAGRIPAHPLGDGKRRTWRFRLTEIEAYLPRAGVNSTPPTQQNFEPETVPATAAKMEPKRAANAKRK